MAGAPPEKTPIINPCHPEAMNRLLTLLLPLAISASASRAAVVLDSNVELGSGSPWEYQLTVFQDAAATDPTSVFLDYRPAALTYQAINLDEGSEWYFADAGDRFEAPTIVAGRFPEFAVFGLEGTTSPIPLGEFFLAVNTGTDFSGADPHREIFGWALLRNTGTGLELMGSAVTYDRPGIVVGTSTTIPEPSISWLLCLGSLLFRRSRRNS